MDKYKFIYMGINYLGTWEKMSVVGKYSVKNIPIELNSKWKIALYIGDKTNSVSIFLPNCGVYILSEHKQRDEAEKKAREFNEKLKKGCLIRIVDEHNATII